MHWNWLLGITVAMKTKAKDGKLQNLSTLKPYNKALPTNLSSKRYKQTFVILSFFTMETAENYQGYHSWFLRFLLICYVGSCEKLP